MEIKDKNWLTRQISPIVDNCYLDVHFYNLLYMICINRFKWIDLPNNIDCDFIEKELANVGELAFIKHDIYGFCVTYCTGVYHNIYNRPTAYICYSSNHEIYEIYEADEVVIIRNNILSQTSHDFIQRYADIIGNIQKTKEINLNAQKTPIHITVDESQLLTLENIYQQYSGNRPVILTNKLFNKEQMGVLRTDAPYLLDRLQIEKTENINECLTFMGINTVAKKKERMIADEVNKGDDMVNICLSMFLNPRIEARNEINKKFGLDVKINLAEYCKNEVDNKPLEINGGGINE